VATAERIELAARETSCHAHTLSILNFVIDPENFHNSCVPVGSNEDEIVFGTGGIENYLEVFRAVCTFTTPPASGGLQITNISSSRLPAAEATVHRFIMHMPVTLL
jgi:hypothetical protein